MSKHKDEPQQNAIVTAEFLQMLTLLDFMLHEELTGRFGGKRRTGAYGNSLEWADFRDYIPGDDLRRIDWSAAARFDKYYIRNYMDERQLLNIIYVDCSGSMAFTGEKASAALRLAAAMAFLSVSNMDRAAFRLLRENRCEPLGRSVSGKEAFIFEAGRLAEARFQGSVDLYEAVASDTSAGNRNGISFLVSDLLTDSNWKNAVDYLLSKKREVVLIHVLTPEEAAPSHRGLLELFETERESSGYKLNNDYGVMRAYQEAYDDWCGEIDAFCHTRHIACVRVFSNELFADVIFGKLMKAGVIR